MLTCFIQLGDTGVSLTAVPGDCLEALFKLRAESFKLLGTVSGQSLAVGLHRLYTAVRGQLYSSFQKRCILVPVIQEAPSCLSGGEGRLNMEDTALAAPFKCHIELFHISENIDKRHCFNCHSSFMFPFISFIFKNSCKS